MSADFKITVANEYKNMSQYVNELLSDINKQQYPEISEDVYKRQRLDKCR